METVFHYIQSKHGFNMSFRKYITAWKASEYGFFSGSYFRVFSRNIGKYRPKNTPYLDTFHAVYV